GAGGGHRHAGRLGQRGARRPHARGHALQAGRDEAAAVLRGAGDEGVARQGGPEARATRARGKAGGVDALSTRSGRCLTRIDGTWRIEMRHELASAAIALLVAARAVAAQALTIDWSQTVVTDGVLLPGEEPGGGPALRLRATAAGPTSFHLVTIDHP